jgi:gas vesicle protein
MASDRRGGAGAYLGWFLFGATLGALTAFLLTPRTGEESREMLGERAGEWIDRGRELLEEQTQRLVSAFEAGRDAMREEMRKQPPTLG